MGIRICSSDEATFLFCSTSMLPIVLQSFDGAEAAESFLSFAKLRRVADIRALNPADLDALHTDWLKLPKCAECRERIVHVGARGDVCSECEPPDEDDYDAGVARELRAP